MKQIPLLLSLLIIGGCQVVPKVSQQTLQASTGCSTQPKTALTQVEEIQLSKRTVTKSGQVSADKSIGYTFAAKAGQKLSYSTKDDVCIWVYTPDNQLLNTKELIQAGKYIFQVSAPRDSTSFNIEIGLDTSQSSSDFQANDQLSANEFVKEYYLNINNRQYKDAWNKLSPKFQSISSSYSDYVDWWNSVSEIKIGEITSIAQSSDIAVVDVELWYVMNNGRVYEDPKKRIYLIWSNESNTWLFNRKSSI